MIKTITSAALIVAGFLFFGEALLAQNNATQSAQPVASRTTAGSMDEQIAMLRSDLRSNARKVAGTSLLQRQSTSCWRR